MSDGRHRVGDGVAAPNPEMWFISISSLKDSSDFRHWLAGKRVECANSMQFAEWLTAYKAFPLEFYLDGVTYHFKTQEEVQLFQCGWEAAMRLRIGNENLS